MNKTIKLALLFSLLCGLSGCATWANPYSEDFDCPNYDKGACVDMQTAYKASLAKKAPSEHKKDCPECSEAEVKGKDGGVVVATAPPAATPSSLYQDALYDKLTSLLKAPMTPVVAPPKVMRVLFLPYRGDDNQLYMSRYLYMMVDPPQWVLSEMDIAEQGDGE